MDRGQARNEIDRLDAITKNKKQALLNKFLSKTYHMIDQCESHIATWSSDGKSFVILDVDQFAKTVLPRYFKHSKFASFVRQLNFYSFRKLRCEPDIRTAAKSVRFAHEYFKRDHPELLHNIQRITKSQDATTAEIQSLRDDISEVGRELSLFSSRLDQRIKSMTMIAERDYQERISNIKMSYQALYQLLTTIQEGNRKESPTPSLSSEKEEDCQSPRSAMSPLETLSGVAAMLSVGMDGASATNET